MRVEAKSIEELIKRSGPHADAIRKVDQLIVSTAPHLTRRLFSGPSITMIGYGELIWQNMSKSGVWPLFAVAPQKHRVTMYIAAEDNEVPLVQLYASRLGRTNNGKNCVRFKHFEDLNLTSLTSLIKDSVAAAEVQSRIYGRDCARRVE